jgi:hypothetical protein
MQYPTDEANSEFHTWLQENVNNRKVAYHRAKEVYKDQPLVLTDVFGSWTEAQYIHDMFHAYLGKENSNA